MLSPAGLAAAELRMLPEELRRAYLSHARFSRAEMGSETKSLLPSSRDLRQRPLPSAARVGDVTVNVQMAGWLRARRSTHCMQRPRP